MGQQQGMVLRAGSASRTAGRQSSPLEKIPLEKFNQHDPTPAQSIPACPPGKRRPVFLLAWKTTPNHPGPAWSPSMGLTTKVKLLGDVAR